MLGLPSVWSRYVLLAVAAGLVLAAISPFLAAAYRRVIHGKRLRKKVLARVFRNCLIFLFAYIYLVGPESFQVLTQADIDYANLTESTWGKVNDVITYFYDANGSLEYKFYGDVDIDGVPETIITNNPTLEYDYYEYNLQGRLSALTKSRYEAPDTVEYVTEYVYSPQGARVRKIDYYDEETTVYLQDLYNHTGYDQVLEEITFDGVDVDPLTDTPTGRITYTIGDDIISQTDENGVNKYLIYDGHGSTRQLQNSTETIVENYNYDAYGIMLQEGTVNPAATTPVQGTSLLYAGEMFDFDMQHYYNRARWYNPYNGRFNRVDPFAGNTQDPQSLHKYLYCHANPINVIDPTGEFALTELTKVIAITAVIVNIGVTVYNGVRNNISAKAIAWQVVQNIAAFIAIVGVFACSGLIAVAAGATLALASIVGMVNLVRSWPKMDTTDRIVAGVTILTFLAFAGAVRAGAVPKLPPRSSFRPGACSELPESYYSRTVVDMRNAPPQSTTALGVPRNSGYFWRQVRSVKPEFFSRQNIEIIRSGKSPRVDSQWIKYHPQHASFNGDTLVHHHIGQGAYATALPESVHQSWRAVLHPNKGN